MSARLPFFRSTTARRSCDSPRFATGATRLAALLAVASPPVLATDPEIMLHENDTAGRGEVVAALHANQTVRGTRESEGDTWPNQQQTNLMAEFATGLAPGWEAAVHLPIRRNGVDSATGQEGAWGSSGVMFRLKHVRMADAGFFYGFNTEYDILARRFSTADRSIEFRGILGQDTDRYRVTLNPVYNWGFGGTSETSRPDFSMNAKALFKATPTVGWGAEIYSLWGKAGDFRAIGGDRTAYVIGEFKLANQNALHVGVGQGFKNSPEKTVLKAVWSSAF